MSSVPLGPVRSLYTSIILPDAAECVLSYLHYSRVRAVFITISLWSFATSMLHNVG